MREHLTVNQGVAGSSPAGGANEKANHQKVVRFFVLFSLFDSNQRHSFATVSSNVVGTDGENCLCNSPQFDVATANLLLQGVVGSSPAGGAI